MSNILVSVCCLTYNHAAYIQKTLDGFLMQKTSFPYEIIVHDDASNDGTAEIIRKCAEEYPALIKPILQKQNQWSLGIDTIGHVIMPRAQGKYIAWCEGDDYWTDPEKLQKQVNFLERHPEYSACVHNTLISNEMTGALSPMNLSHEDYDVSFDEIILADSCNVFHFSSLLYRKEFAVDMSSPDCPPFFFNEIGVGDLPLAMHLALKGKIRYLAEPMSVYRTLVPNSWSSKNAASIDERKRTLEGISHMLEAVDEYSHHQYHDCITQAIIMRKISIAECNRNFAEMLRPEYKEMFRKRPFIVRLTAYMYTYFPNTSKFLYKIKKRLTATKK